MTHRRYGRTRKAIHKAMARNPGQRKPKYLRLEEAKHIKVEVEQSPIMTVQPKPIISAKIKVEQKFYDVKPTKSFFRRLFNRKTGG